MAASTEHIEYQLVTKDDMNDFMVRCMVSVGTNPKHARQLADALVESDYRGHFSHGLNKFAFYIRDVREGVTKPDGEPTVVKNLGATAVVDGHSLLGPVVGTFCMDLAIQKARDFGIGIVVARESTHYGMAGFYSLRALKQKLIGFTCTNTSPVVFPTRAKNIALGTNPISFAAPGKEDDSYVLDMATSAVAWGKVEINYRKGLSIPPNWGVDKHGQPTTNPNDVFDHGGLLPLGGVEESSGYKGYGLAFLVEILTSHLSGAASGPNIRNWKEAGHANLGQCFMAINPEFFEGGFEDRLQGLIDHCRNLEPIDPEKPVLIAGDPERKHSVKCDELGAIPYHPNQIKFANDLAEQCNVERVRVTSTLSH